MPKNIIIKLAAVTITLVLLGAGCANNTAGSQNNNQNNIGANSPGGQTSAIKEFNITADNWSFSPATLNVNKGDRVKLTLRSMEGTHGFYLADYNINVRLEPGKTQIVEFTANNSGTFPFRCNIPCGEGHGGMAGKLVVR